ncbi:MAG: hypothetical protein ABIH00_06790 [Armatimonadota bacterium]
MFLPKGNPLIESIKLDYTDINIMINNLEQEGFSGYLYLEYQEGAGVFFFLHGGIINTIEIIKGERETYHCCLASKFFNRIRKKQMKASTYVLTPSVTSVLSNIYLFKSIYEDYSIQKKDLMVLLSEIEDKSYTGFLKSLSMGAASYILFDKGKFLVDNFAAEIGQISCSSDKIHVFLDEMSVNGGKISFYAEENSVLEEKKKEIQVKLNKIKQLIIKGENRFLGRGDIVKIDEYIVREWGIKEPSFVVEVETSQGASYKLHASPGKKLGGYIGFSNSLIKKMGLKEGDLVNINPVDQD